MDRWMGGWIGLLQIYRTRRLRLCEFLVSQATSTIAFSSTATGALVGAVTYWSLLLAEKLVCKLQMCCVVVYLLRLAGEIT